MKTGLANKVIKRDHFYILRISSFLNLNNTYNIDQSKTFIEIWYVCCQRSLQESWIRNLMLEHTVRTLITLMSSFEHKYNVSWEPLNSYNEVNLRSLHWIKEMKALSISAVKYGILKAYLYKVSSISSHLNHDSLEIKVYFSLIFFYF